MTNDYWPEVAVRWQPDDETGETGTLDVVVRYPTPPEYIDIEIAEGGNQGETE